MHENGYQQGKFINTDLFTVREKITNVLRFSEHVQTINQDLARIFDRTHQHFEQNQPRNFCKFRVESHSEPPV
jgi:hypothetical protein